MKTWNAYFRKEWMEQLRTGRVTILSIIFVLFGMMSPAIAKLTPWMMEMLSDSLAENGMTVTSVEVTALTSWTQFYKNIPLALIIFVLIFAGIMTAEYQKGTLIPVLTKGLSRFKVLCAKAFILLLFWSGGFSLCWGITFGYNACFWDQSLVQNLMTAAFSYYLFGLWVISLTLLFSAAVSTNTGVLLGTGGTVLTVYLLSMIPALQEYLPMRLTDSMPLLTGNLSASDLTWSIAITLSAVIMNLFAAILTFNRRSL